MLHCHHDFTNSDYVAFDERGFVTRIKIRIPALFMDEYGRFCVPTPDDEYNQYALLDLIEYFAQNIQETLGVRPHKEMILRNYHRNTLNMN